MTVSTTKAASYIDQLKRIATAESNAGRTLAAWADVTPDPELASTLRLVAARETSHGEVFARRLAELGVEFCCTPDRAAYARLAQVANPDISDLEKIGPLVDDADPFGPITRRIAEGEYDPMTANLMTWFIGEERDTLARLRACYEALRARAGQPRGEACEAPAGPSADAQAIMACMTEGFARLEKSMDKLARAIK